MKLELHAQLFIVFWLFSCGLAFAVGRRSERIVALVILLGVLLSALALPSRMASRFLHIEQEVMIIDCAMAVCFGFIAHHFRENWLIWITAFQILVVASNFPILLRPLVSPESYVTISALWSWIVVLLLLQASIKQWRQKRRPTSNS